MNIAFPKYKEHVSEEFPAQVAWELLNQIVNSLMGASPPVGRGVTKATSAEALQVLTCFVEEYLEDLPERPKEPVSVNDGSLCCDRCEEPDGPINEPLREVSFLGGTPLLLCEIHFGEEMAYRKGFNLGQQLRSNLPMDESLVWRDSHVIKEGEEEEDGPMTLDPDVTLATCGNCRGEGDLEVAGDDPVDCEVCGGTGQVKVIRDDEEDS